MRPCISIFVLLLAAGAPARAESVDDLGRTATSDPKSSARAQAAAALGRLHDHRALAPLLRALADPSEMVRGVAATALGELGEADAIAPLERGRKDPSAFVRDQVEMALESLRAAAPPPAPVAAAQTKSPPPPPPPPVKAGPLHVELGEVGNRTSQTSTELPRRLRAFLARKLSETPLPASGSALTGYRLDSAITRLQRRTVGPIVEITCEVGLVLGLLPSNTIVMTTSGAATVQASAEHLTRTQEQALQIDALEGAANGAHANIVSFLKSRK
jgi:hypothetical protein